MLELRRLLSHDAAFYSSILRAGVLHGSSRFTISDADGFGRLCVAFKDSPAVSKSTGWCSASSQGFGPVEYST